MSYFCFILLVLLFKLKNWRSLECGVDLVRISISRMTTAQRDIIWSDGILQHASSKNLSLTAFAPHRAQMGYLLGTPGATGMGSNASLWHGCHSVLAHS